MSASGRRGYAPRRQANRLATHPYARALVRDPRLYSGLALLAVLLGAALCARWVAPAGPHALSGRPLERPSMTHPLGTNDVGQDLLAMLLYGARTSLTIGFAAALLSTALAWGVGLLAGAGQRADAVATTLTDLLLALPFLPLAILLIAHLGGRPAVVILTLGLLSWPAFARVIRARVRGELRQGYVEAARALGARPARLLLRHLLPATVPVATAKFVLTVQYAVLAEASLAFLGLGDPATVSWGGLVHRASGYSLIFATDAWRWWLLPPVLGIATLVLASALVGWALDDAAEGR